MQLQDLESAVLTMLQQPGANFGGAPGFAALSNPQFGKSTIDFYINRGYARLLDDLAETELAEYTATFLSVAMTNYYPLPPPSYLGSLPPAVKRLNRVSYSPNGLPYTVEFAAGSRFVSWDEFQSACGQGYLIPFSYSATVPDICAMSPDRSQLAFFPGSGSAGDTITIKYAPMWTVGSNVGPLVLNTDTPYFPEDCHDAIVFYALSQLWVKGRELGTAQYYKGLYDEEVQRLRESYLRGSRGDKLGFSSKADELASRYWPV